MRKKQLTYGAMTALALTLGMTSCQNEMSEYTPSEGKHITFTATQEVASATQEKASVTRTYLNDNKIVVWSAGETVSLFDSESVNCLFELVKGADQPVGEFDGTVSSNARKEYYAVYPYSQAYNFESGTATDVILPAEQTAVANGFDRNAAIMTGYTTNIECLPFKQLCAFVQVTTESASKKITFRSNGTENLAGTLDVTIADAGADKDKGTGTATVTDNGSNTVSLVPATGSTSIAAGTYLIAVLPGDLEEGFTMEIDAVEGDDLTRSFENRTEVLKRAAVIDMGTASVAEGRTSQAYHECTHTYSKGAFAPTANNGTGEEGIDWVDLGIRLNGKKILFATRNLGASSPEEYGDYYAWGATEPWCIGYDQNGTTLTASNDAAYVARHWKDGKSAGYISDNEPFYSGSAYTKYTTDGEVLEESDDAAHVQWGADWRIPTLEEQKALYDNTTSTWTNNYNNTGIAGCIFTGKGDYANRSLFLPAAGDFCGTQHYPFYGEYWSSTLSHSTQSYYLECREGGDYVYLYCIMDRNVGLSVRAVRAVPE